MLCASFCFHPANHPAAGLGGGGPPLCRRGDRGSDRLRDLLQATRGRSCRAGPHAGGFALIPVPTGPAGVLSGRGDPQPGGQVWVPRPAPAGAGTAGSPPLSTSHPTTVSLPLHAFHTRQAPSPQCHPALSTPYPPSPGSTRGHTLPKIHAGSSAWLKGRAAGKWGGWRCVRVSRRLPGMENFTQTPADVSGDPPQTPRPMHGAGCPDSWSPRVSPVASDDPSNGQEAPPHCEGRSA